MERLRIMCALTMMLVMGFVMIGGCARSQPAKVYLLHSLSEGGKMTTEGETVPNLTIGVGPVEVPKYLDRPQIVTRTSQNELRLAEFDRWGEPLEDTVTRVLAENLSTLLATDRISLFPRIKSTEIDYQVVVEVVRFEGELGGTVSLEARWSILGEEDKKTLMTKKTVLSVATESQEYEGLVSAQSRVLADLSREIAGAITVLSQEKPDESDL